MDLVESCCNDKRKLPLAPVLVLVLVLVYTLALVAVGIGKKLSTHGSNNSIGRNGKNDSLLDLEFQFDSSERGASICTVGMLGH